MFSYGAPLAWNQLQNELKLKVLLNGREAGSSDVSDCDHDMFSVLVHQIIVCNCVGAYSILDRNVLLKNFFFY